MQDAGSRDKNNICLALFPASCILHPHFSDQGGSRTHKHEALDLAALPVCVPSRWRVRGSHPTGRAYEAPLSTGSPAVSSSQGESRTRMPRVGTTF